MPNERPTSSKPTLENLFELKRSERPPETFWKEFDARLREKQLAALIPVSSGWSRIFPGLGRFAKLGLPMAAAIAVVVGIVSFNRQVWQSGQPSLSGQPVEGRELATAGATEPQSHSMEVAEVPETADPVRTVVIEAGARTVVAATVENSTADSRNDQILNAEEISRTLPWLANVDLKRNAGKTGLHLGDPLQLNQGPSTLAVNTFEASRSEVQPVWAPTEENIRAAVASEIGIAPAYASKTQPEWMARVVAANVPTRLMNSRVESEYRGEVSRVGLTASTLSIKF